MTDKEAAEKALSDAGFRRVADLAAGGMYANGDGVTRVNVYNYRGVEFVDIYTKLAALPALLQQGYTEAQVREAIEAGLLVLGDYGDDDLAQASETILHCLREGS